MIHFNINDFHNNFQIQYFFNIIPLIQLIQDIIIQEIFVDIIYNH